MSGRVMMSGYIQSPKLSYGRRSKKPLGVIIRKLSNGRDDVNSYFPTSDDEFDIDEEISEQDDNRDKTKHVESSNEEFSAISSEEELCKEERIKIISDQNERTLEDRFPVSFREGSRCDARKSVVSSPHAISEHDSNVREDVLGTISSRDIAKPSTPKRRSNGMNSSESIPKFQDSFTHRCPLPNDALIGSKIMTPKRQSKSADYRLNSPISVIRTTLDGMKTQKGEVAFCNEDYQNIGIETSQIKQGMSVHLSEQNTEIAEGNPGSDVQKSKQKQRKRSMRDIAVSTNDLKHDDEDDDDDVDVDDAGASIYETFGNRARHNNGKKQTRYIVIERTSNRIRPEEEIERKRHRQNEFGVSALRGTKYAARDHQRSVQSRNRKPLALRKPNLSSSASSSSSDDNRLGRRANAYPKKVAIKSSRARDGVRKQLQKKKKKKPSVIDGEKMEQSNETEGKAFANMSHNAQANGSKLNLQPERKEKRRRCKKIAFPSKKKSKSETKVENVAKNIGNRLTASRDSPRFHFNANGLETPRSRSSSRLTSPNALPSWTGPSPHSTENASAQRAVRGSRRSSHPTRDKRRNTPLKFVVDNDVNTLPGGSHSEHECETMKENGDDMKEEEKPRLVKKRRKYTRVCFPGARRKNAKSTGGVQKLSPRKNTTEYGEEKTKPSPPIKCEDNTANAAATDQNKRKKNDKRSSKALKAVHENVHTNIPTSMLVRDDNDNLVRMDMIFTRAMLRLTTPGKLPDGRDFSHFFLHKFFEQPLFNAGIFVLLPLAEKGHQFVQSDTLVFLVISGEVEFVIENVERRLGPDSHFFVSRGNAYNIKNVTEENAMLYYVQIKGKDKNILSS